MDTHFSSLQMIKDQLGIDGESIDELRSKIRAIQMKYHPDKNGGDFVDEETKKQYLKLDEAISYIDTLKKQENFDLVTISAVTDLTRAVTAMVTAQNEVSNKETQLSSEIGRSIENYSSRLKIPKIALTAITVAISAIWMFPNTVKDHPVLSRFINFESMTISIIWLYILFGAVFFWFITWRKEESNKEFQESLKTESIQNSLFTKFIKNVDSGTFTLEEFVEFIMHSHRNRTLIFPPFRYSSQIDSSLAHATAEVILERAIKRDALKSYNSGSISTMYKITI